MSGARGREAFALGVASALSARVALVLGGAGLLGIASALSARSALAAYPDCPAAGAGGLTQWREEAIQSFGTYGVALFPQSCFANGVPACLSRLRGLSEKDAPNSSYPASARPELAQMPSEFLAPGGGGYVLPPNVEAIARSRGWTTVKFKSRGGGGFDATSNVLYLIQVPGSSFAPPLSYDRYIQFTLPADLDSANPVPSSRPPGAADYQVEAQGGIRLPLMVAMITMERGNGSTPARPYYQLFERPTRGSPVFKPKTSGAPRACYECHSNGLRPISPLGYHTQPGEAELPSEAKATIQRLNRDMSSYGPPDWRSAADSASGRQQRFVRPDSYGPPLGPPEPLTRNAPATGADDRFPTRAQAFFEGDGARRGCMSGSSTVSFQDALGRPGLSRDFTLSGGPLRWQKVRDAMICASCHDGANRMPINREVSRDAVAFKLLVDKSMPPGASDLTQDERIALFNCLYAEEAQEFTSWLRNPPCEAAPPAAPGSPSATAAAGSELSACPLDAGAMPTGRLAPPAATSLPGLVPGRPDACVDPRAVSARDLDAFALLMEGPVDSGSSDLPSAPAGLPPSH